jgi:autotransporter family porin
MSWQAPSWGQMPENQNGTFPFTIRSTAFALDYLASQLRGCYNGWQYWLKDSGKYAAGDLWGCVGAWYAGDWHSPDADGYISRVRKELADFTWLQADWPSVKPSCDRTYGCPLGSS